MSVDFAAAAARGHAAEVEAKAESERDRGVELDAAVSSAKKKGKKSKSAKEKALSDAGAGAGTDAAKSEDDIRTGAGEPRLDGAGASADAETGAGAGAGTGAGAGASAGARAVSDLEDFDLPRMKQNLLYGFAATASKFLDVTTACWPKDPVLQAWHATLNGTASASDDKGREAFYSLIITTFHDGFRRHYAQINNRDEAMLADETNVWLKRLRAKAKYRASTPVIRAQLWKFVEQLASMSNLWALYARCPPKLFERIKVVLGGFAARVKAGKTTVRQLDPMQIARELMSSMGKDELRAFAQSVTAEGGLEAISALFSSLAPLLNESGFDMTALARKLQDAMRGMM
jgi:hypothetical protein